MPFFVLIEVSGHAPQTEQVEPLVWQATCPCGYMGLPRESLEVANEDRFAHEDEIGMRQEVPDSDKG